MDHSESEQTVRLANKLCCAAVLFTALAALFGCDLTGQYDKKFHAALEASSKRAVFDLLHQAVTDAIDPSKGVGVKLRLPTVFDNNSKAVTQPAFAMPNIPGMPTFSTYGLSRDLDDDQGKWAPCTISIIAMQKRDQKGDAFQNTMLKGLSTMMPGSTWSDVSVPTPDGQTTTLKKMRIDMSQMAAQIAAKTGGKVDAAKLESAMAGSIRDMYLIDVGGAAVIVTWGVPAAQAKKYNLEKAIEASMGTVEVTAPPPAEGAGKAGAPKGPAAAKAPPTGCM